jgi:hypothetical protein
MQLAKYIAKGQLIPLTFTQDAVAANQTDVQLSVNENAATSIHLAEGYAMPWAGSIVGISALLDTAATAGSLTVGATVNGTEGADPALSITTEAKLTDTAARDAQKFVAGDEIGAEITTDGSWDGTASDLVVVVWVLLELEGI